MFLTEVLDSGLGERHLLYQPGLNPSQSEQQDRPQPGTPGPWASGRSHSSSPRPKCAL